ncbi:hypothetical protein [Algoriphagus marinus]|uniref:hypothetical protein n=1 Tax=Algoriphagus marinus TaxID=1925762 RepID=UPI00094BA557|nr:hypothetical protein [Algoriphagus marinus]
MKYLFTSIILIFFMLSASAQEFESKVPSKSIYVELGGAGLPYSFNYDFRFDKSKVEGWGMRVGLGGYTTTNESFFSAPIMVNRLYGKGVHFFEIGIGATVFAFDNDYSDYCISGYFDQNTGQYICQEYSSSSYSFILDVDGSPSVMGTMNFGYRRIPVDGGFTWKVNLNPIFNNNGFWPLYAGVGFGYAF